MARLLIAVGVFALGACSAAPPPAPVEPAKPCEPLAPQLALTATRRTNPTAEGEGRPVQIRIYQLRSDGKLRTATFEDVWQNDAKTFEGEMVSVEQQTLFPGETKQVPVQPKPDAHYLAIVALFREPQGKDWFVSYELSPPAQKPPCPTKASTIPVWLDRMQIQDGAGREAEVSEETQPAGGNH